MRRFALLLLALFSPGCDGGEAAGPFDGVWQQEGLDELYLVITPTAFAYHDFQGDSVDRGAACFIVQRYRLDGHTGATYTLSAEGVRSTLTLRRVEGRLEAESDAGVARFSPSARTEAELKPVC